MSHISALTLPTADLLARNAFGSILGRAPTDAELAIHIDFIADNGSDAYETVLNEILAGAGFGIPEMATALINNLNLDDVGITQDIAEAYLSAFANPVAAMIDVADMIYRYNGDDASVMALHDTYSALIDGPAPEVPGVTLDVTEATAAGTVVMKLAGDQDIRVDLTQNDNQIRGVDLDGDGAIENNGDEVFNVVTGNDPTDQDDGIDFAIVDAYARNPLNEGDVVRNFLGDIEYDGTGYGGDGVSTDGNIVLGGLGVDTIFGGIGNDFLAGGSVADARIAEALAAWRAQGGTIANFVAPSDTLYGGRNADFFFVELSALDNTDQNVDIDGGNTADNSAAGGASTQDTDWLLLEASDDDEPVTVTLGATVTTRSGTGATIVEVENLDASGNLYGFIDDVDVQIGGRVIDDRDDAYDGPNLGIGSSAQLRVIGNGDANRIIGGYDNDNITGGDSADLLMGGNLKSYTTDGETIAHELINPNLVDLIRNDGMDLLDGGDGSDNIVFEADGGVITGGDDAGDNGVLANDTVRGGSEATARLIGGDVLWVTENALGTDATGVLADNTLRFDLAAEDLDDASGYGGADTADSQDQSNYGSVTGMGRVTITGMENVIATGLGGVDYAAAGANDPEGSTEEPFNFTNLQNHQRYVGNLDLRGNVDDNMLYASSGADKLEGREGDDNLMGGGGNDDFIFDLQGGDDLDVIWRQSDANGDNVWDGYNAATGAAGTYERDFKLGGSDTTLSSFLRIDFSNTDIAAANKGLAAFQFTVGDVDYALTDLARLLATDTLEELADWFNTDFDGEPVSASVEGDVLVITDEGIGDGGREFTDFVVLGAVEDQGQTITNPVATYVAPGQSVAEDRLIFASYDDRLDNELIDDDANFGGDSLGGNAYAQDLVVTFDRNGDTVLAEGQSFNIDFENLAVEDEVTVNVNGVLYTLTVGRDLDGTLIAGENTQEFVARLKQYINTFLDDDTAAGQVAATDDGDTANDGGALEDVDGTDGDTNTATLTLTQAAYNDGEEVVFMQVSVDVDDNSSNGEPATAAVTNASATDITLYQFDGRNAELHSENVLFVGDSGVGPDGRTHSENSRAVLATAATAGGELFGSDAIVVNVTADVNILSSAEEGIDGAEIFFNTTENPTTGNADNYAIHGDDQLFGGDGADDIFGGTGDDRFYGSRGLDDIDGGKDLWLVDQEIRVLNDFEATEVDADPDVLSIEQIADGAFVDTLVYQQADFGTVGAGGAQFYITLDDDADFPTGGTGTVVVTEDGVATGTAGFTNMEFVRTVSGDGTLAGQGNDTLDVNALSDGTGGIRYDLTSAGTGMVEVDNDADDMAAGSVDYNVEQRAFADFFGVDGVENIVSGDGDDVVMIDETEAGKNNSFSAGLGTDAIEYSFDVNGDDDFNPAVTFIVSGGGADVDYVDMVGGLLKAEDEPRDTLTSVEIVDFSDALNNPALDDTLDVQNVADAVVDFINGEVRDDGDLINNDNDEVVSIIEMQNFEIVVADGDDTVLVSDAMANSRLANDDADLVFDSFLNYDLLDERGAAPARLTVADLRAIDGGTADTADEDNIPEAENIGLFHFNLGQDNDTVDYGAETGLIAAVVDFTQESPSVANVLVSHDGDTDFEDAGNRVDSLTGVENLAAAQGESIIDLTGATQSLRISFSNNYDNVADWDSDFSVDFGRETHEVKVASAVTGSSVVSMNFLDYRYVDTDTTDAVAAPADARWNRIEGSDFAEEVDLTGYEAGFVNTLTLRGGDNQVNYEGDSVEITIDITAYDENAPTTTGLIEVTSVHTAPGDDHDAGTADADVFATDVISSYSAQNEIAAGSLTIKGARGDLDTVAFAAGLDGKFFVLGGVTDATSSLTVTIGSGADANSIELVGFELLQDAATDDSYQMDDLDQILDDLLFVDNAANDRDTIVVFDDAVDFLAAPADTISLEVLNDEFGFDFDVLDITNVTDGDLLLVGDDDDEDNDATLNQADGDYAGNSTAARELADDVVVGDLGLIDDVTGFVNLWMTDASIDGNGDEYILALDAGELQEGDGDTVFTFDGTGLNFSLVTSGVTATIDSGATGGMLVGSGEDDTLTGGGGDDDLEGGAGADNLDGGQATEVRQIQLAGIFGAGTADGDVAFDFNGFTGVLTTVTEGVEIVDGAGSDAVGAALAATFTTNLAAINAGAAWTNGELVSVSYDNGTDLLTFTFTGGADVLDAETISAVVTAGTDASTLAVSAETIVTQGSDGGSDTYIYRTAGDGGVAGTLASAAADSISSFLSGDDVIQFSDDLLGLTGTTGDAAANAAYAAAYNGAAFAGSVRVIADGAATATAADLTNIADLQAAFGAITNEFAGDELLIAFNSGDGNAALYYWVAGDAGNDLDAAELTLLGMVDSNVDAADFAFV